MSRKPGTTASRAQETEQGSPTLGPSELPDGKERILDATIRVIAQRGMRGMTYRAVADEAGVNNTLISYHFGSRHALLIAAMDWAVARTSAWIGTAGAVTRSDSFPDEVVGMVLDDPDLQVFQYEMLFESRRVPELHQSVSALYERYITQIADALEERGYADARSRARLVFATLDGLVLQQLTVADQDEIRRSLSLVAESLLARSSTPEA